MARRVDFIQYNVLSSHLCDQSAYPQCQQDALDPFLRLTRIKRLLAERLESGLPAVVALQEVASDWRPQLQRFFKEQGMRSIFAEHGSAWDGRMGVMLAFTTRDLRLVRFKSVLIADVSSFVARAEVAVPPPRDAATPRKLSIHRSARWTWLMGFGVFVMNCTAIRAACICVAHWACASAYPRVCWESLVMYFKFAIIFVLFTISKQAVTVCVHRANVPRSAVCCRFCVERANAPRWQVCCPSASALAWYSMLLPCFLYVTSMPHKLHKDWWQRTVAPDATSAVGMPSTLQPHAEACEWISIHVMLLYTDLYPTVTHKTELYPTVGVMTYASVLTIACVYVGYISYLCSTDEDEGDMHERRADAAEPDDARAHAPAPILSAEARAKRFKQWLKARPASCPIAVAMSKRNRMLWMRLAWADSFADRHGQEGSCSDSQPPALGEGKLNASARSSSDFCVATYHMPCVFRDQRVMVLHASLFAQRAAALSACADGVALPLALLGDFNSQPGSDAYRALTTRVFENVPEPALPSWLFHGGSPWCYGLRGDAPFRSCYIAYAGVEPETTNYTFQSYSADGAFSGTLDYIFISSHWRVVSVRQLPGVAELKLEALTNGALSSEGYLPSVLRPSDHLCIAATVELFEPHRRKSKCTSYH